MALFIAEERVTPASIASESGVRQQVKQLWQAITRKSILLPTTFIFLWQATPSADSAFFYFTTNELNFEPEFLGRVRLVTGLASLFGIWFYQHFLKSLSFRLTLGWSTVISAFLGMTSLLLVTHANRSLGIDDRWFSLGDSLILTVMGQIAFLPILVLSARLCPVGIEASLFALLMSIYNLSGLVSQELGALLTHWLGVTETDFQNLWLLVIVANVSTLLPLPLIRWLPQSDPQTIENVFTPAGVYEHHATGPLGEPSYLPDIVPELLDGGETLRSIEN
jgi:folate/biopterin transporter